MLTYLWCLLWKHDYSGWSTFGATVPPMRVCNRCGHRDAPYVWRRRG